ncbi:MAG: DEAD/DEAH box helicase [Clostridia bacterium]|nr:DEAD/DEAH box helicase [Clostridia bacterium]
MKYNPYEYQEYATRFIEKNEVAAIFLECGLGKSVITLTAIKNLTAKGKVHKVLVIAPLRVAKNTWPDEIEKWEHLKGLTYSVAIGTASERVTALKRNAMVTIINRENVEWLIAKSGVKFDYDMVVVDELSSFKSYKAKRFRYLLKARPSIERIVGLTGTPSSNGLMDLWAEFRLLDMGERLGRYITRYREGYFTPDKRNAQVVFSYKPLPGAEERIYGKISDITISMKAKDYIKMPELITNNVLVEMPEREKSVYDMLKSDLVVDVKGVEIDAVNAAVLSNKLLQMANGAIYGDAGKVIPIHDEKLDALEDLIESANGKSVLVAYWFKHDLTRIKARFPFIREIKTSKDISDWNSGVIQVGLIHPASAGHGLNLQTGGSTLIWFGLTWSLELYQQTNARLYRQGQKNTVVIHHILTKGTMDERVLKAVGQKEKTQNALIDAVKAELVRCA